MDLVKLVIFDLDGTLVDSDKTVIRLLNTIREDLNLPTLKIKDISFYLSLGGEEMIKKTIANEIDTKHYLEIFRQRYLDDSLDNENLFDGVIDYLNHLKSKGIITANITDLTAQIQFRKLVYFGLDELFDYVVTSEEAGADKPDKKAFELALKKLKFLPHRSDFIVWIIFRIP